jgi:membrane-associated phospholipid phosphatase
MLVSAVPSGNHYLADVLTGIVVAFLAIACGGAIESALDRLFSRRGGFDYARRRIQPLRLREASSPASAEDHLGCSPS